MKTGEPFTGIGGLSLGLERAGHEATWFAENNPYCSRVLAHRWPSVPNYGDITAEDFEWPACDLLVGGFPCQDVSAAHTRGANSRAGLTGPKSGLWWVFAIGIAIIRPQWVVIENVYSGWPRWLPDVRRSLWTIGYASLPLRLSSAQFGAPHRRERVFVVAHADRDSEPLVPIHAEASRLCAPAIPDGYWRETPPGVLRMDDGVPSGLDRLRGVGNAVVPQMAEWIGRQIGG